MNKYLIFSLMLCLFTFACEQESITTQLTTQNNELTDRAEPCHLAQIPLYIPAPEFAEGETIDFNTKFPVTKSADYEAANETNINIEQITYNVNGAASESQVAYEGNDNYDLSISVRYIVNGTLQQETFSLCYQVEGQRLKWGCTDYCEYSYYEEEALESRTLVTSAIILP